MSSVPPAGPVEPTIPSDSEDQASPADLAVGAFSSTPPWLVDPAEMPWRAGIDELRSATARTVPDLIRARRLPPGRRVLGVAYHLARALGGWYLLDRRRARRAGRPSPVAGRSVAPPAPGLSNAGADLHKAGADPLVRGRALSAGAGGGVPAAARPGSARAVRHGAGGRRGGPGPAARGGVHLLRQPAARRRIDSPGARRPAANGRGGGGKGAAPRRGLLRSHRPGGHELAGALPDRSHTGGGAGQSAGPGGAVRRDHRGGAGLPSGGRQHARRGPGSGRHRPALGSRSPTSSPIW